VVVKVPYNLRLSEEVKIYQKSSATPISVRMLAPHTLEIASMFAILSRLEPTSKCDLMTKLRLYKWRRSGREGPHEEDRRGGVEGRYEARRVLNGISTRFIMKALETRYPTTYRGTASILSMFREALISMTKEADLPDDSRKQYLEIPARYAAQGISGVAGKEITRAFVYSYQEQAEALFQKLPRPCGSLR